MPEFKEFVLESLIELYCERLDYKKVDVALELLKELEGDPLGEGLTPVPSSSPVPSSPSISPADRLYRHFGHPIEITDDPDNIAVECTKCNEVIVSYNRPVASSHHSPVMTCCSCDRPIDQAGFCECDHCGKPLCPICVSSLIYNNILICLPCQRLDNTRRVSIEIVSLEDPDRVAHRLSVNDKYIMNTNFHSIHDPRRIFYEYRVLLARAKNLRDALVAAGLYVDLEATPWKSE